MADLKISQLNAISVLTPATDVLPVVDVGGVTKKITTNQILGSGGTATLASATITGAATVGTTLGVTGNLTVGTNALIVFPATNRVLINQTAAIQGDSLEISAKSDGGTISLFGRASDNGSTLTFRASTTVTPKASFTANDTGLSIRTGTVERYNIDATGISTWSVAGTTAMTLNSTGLALGMSFSSPWATNRRVLQIGGTNSGAIALTGTDGSGELFFNSFNNSSSQNICVVNGGIGKYDFNVGTVGCHTWSVGTGTAGTAFTFTKAMTLDASSQLFVGTTASGGQNGFCVLRPLNNGVVATTAEIAHNYNALTGATYATFLYATGAIGSITQNGITGVLYNTSSDYRLKESVKPLNGGLARVNALKPSVYNWKSDGSTGEGFLAHELAEVVPTAVSGEKDAVNADGTIKSQGVDISRIVPILVAAIQELTAEVNALKNA